MTRGHLDILRSSGSAAAAADLVVVLQQLDDDLDVVVIVLDRYHSHDVGRILGVRVLAVLVGQHQARVCLLHLPVQQEALLPQTDRATKSCQLLHNCRNELLYKSVTNRSDEVRVAVGRRVVNSHDGSTIVGVVNKLHRRQVLLTTRSTCRGGIL